MNKFGLPIMPCINIFTSQPFYILTFLPGLIGPALNIEVQRVDRARGKYRSVGHFG